MKTQRLKKVLAIDILSLSLLILFLSVGASTIFAQMGSIGNSMSNFGLKFGNFNAVNPAFQSIDSGGVFIALPTFSVAVANNNMSIDDANYYFGNKKSKYLTDTDKQKILSTFDDDGRYYTKINASLAKLYIGLGRMGTIGFEINDYINGNLILPKQFVELALIGNELDKNYTFDNLNIKSWWVRNYAFNYAKQIYKRNQESKSSIEALTIGAKFKYIQGFAYLGTESIHSLFYTDYADNSLKGSYQVIARTAFSSDLGVGYDFDSTYSPNKNYNLFPNAAGSGVGIDIGFDLLFSNGINLSLAINDIGSLKWDKHTAEHKFSGNFFINDIFDSDQLDSLIEMNKDESKYIPEFSTALPSNLQVGASVDIAKHIQPFDKWIWFVNYSQGFNSASANSTKPIFELGNYFSFGEWIPSGLVALRYDETGSFRIPVMINYTMQYFFIGFNSLDILSLFTSSAKKPNFSAGITLGLKFN